MKSLVALLEILLQDCGRKSGAPVERDVLTLRRRTEHEGDSFITITLPQFCADFERSLDTGRIAPGSFLSFGKVRAGIPSFLKGFLCKVFGPDGDLLLDPSVDCIRSIRQICLFGKKVHRPCSDARVRDAAEAYAECDGNIAESLPDSELSVIYGQVADFIVSQLGLGDQDAWEDEFLPQHGPGATREHISGNQKWIFRRWHMRLEWAGIKYWRYAKGTSFPSYTHYNPLPAFVGPGMEEPVRVVFVPKTLKTPRVIAVEPVCMQYVQQGLSKILMRHLEKCRFTSGRINFIDQEVNKGLARQASAHSMLATLDMSEASDRVSLAHVRRLFKSAPRFLEWIESCRSTRAQLPNGEVISLKKWASMGSALCFPVEALVFFTSILASQCYRLGLPPKRALLRSLAEDTFVYGDDLVVPVDMAPSICDDLETLGFKVNRRKSFWTGQFRESCGSDRYDSESVTPVYLRRDLPTSREDYSGFVSGVATCNQLFEAGYTSTARAVQTALERLFGALPQVPPNSPAIGVHYHSEVVPRRRWNADLQRREYLCWVAVAAKRSDSLDGSEQALAKCWRTIGNPLIDRRHLEQSSRPYALTLKRKWVPFL